MKPKSKTFERTDATVRHTPGPWNVTSSEQDSLYVENENSIPITSLYDIQPSLGMGDMRSNARLISAAPELLEAARLMEDALAEHGRMISTKQVKALKLLVHAIAKATGGAE